MDKAKTFLLASLFLVGCTAKQQHNLSSVQLVDRNGMNETISAQEKLDSFAKISYENPQPYQKVVRVYKKDQEGKVKARATTYHENGQIYQYLETVSGRANGVYKEWYSNGKLRMQAYVIEGLGDLTEDAQSTWVFDKDCYVFDRDGSKIAEIYYQKGSLEGTSKYYHPNGALSKTIPYKKDQIHGDLKLFKEDGQLIAKTSYVDGLKHGISYHEKDQDTAFKEEVYQKGYLLEGKYYNYQDEIIAEIVKGYGKKAVFAEGSLKSMHEYKQGIMEGEMLFFREDGSLESKHCLHHGKKEGQEIVYHPFSSEPMLSVMWLNDEIHGTVRTWYQNGRLESEREMSHNKKQGMGLAWYEDGSLMLVEDYENDLLISGKYLKKGQDEPTSRVIGGNGIATLFNASGEFLRKVEYRKGKPTE
ncbi:MAG: hypothetical protein FJZ56_02360 [Chlamydiae bacterium]|nr:hypothetical protein [Chlamydiota bacterium]